MFDGFDNLYCYIGLLSQLIYYDNAWQCIKAIAGKSIRYCMKAFDFHLSLSLIVSAVIPATWSLTQAPTLMECDVKHLMLSSFLRW